MSLRIPTITDVRAAEQVIRQHVSPPPLIRSYALERELQLPSGTHVLPGKGLSAPSLVVDDNKQAIGRRQFRGQFEYPR